MQYRLDNYARQPETLMRILAKNCKDRRLDKGYSRRTLSNITGIPAPTIERFENTGKISMEYFCRLVIEFEYFDEMAGIIGSTKYSTTLELETINRNKGRKNGR